MRTKRAKTKKSKDLVVYEAMPETATDTPQTEETTTEPPPLPPIGPMLRALRRVSPCEARQVITETEEVQIFDGLHLASKGDWIVLTYSPSMDQRVASIYGEEQFHAEFELLLDHSDQFQVLKSEVSCPVCKDVMRIKGPISQEQFDQARKKFEHRHERCLIESGIQEKLF
jgi:hypothetical protein